MSTCDVVVVGRGMIGAAAGRRLAEMGLAVTLVGPAEPVDYGTADGPFASHFDEGRVTRIAGRDRLWAQLALGAIGRYRDIEERSGIDFYTPNALAVAVEEIDDWITAGRANGSDIREVDAAWLHDRTGIVIENGHPIGYEGPPAGHINPRRLVAAQTRLAEMAGATVVAGTAAAITDAGGRFRVSGPWGAVEGRQVLLATGAFGQGLLDLPLRVDHLRRTVLVATVPEPTSGPAAGAGLPSLILSDPPDPLLAEIYWVPPVRYPDGNLGLKIGCDRRGCVPASDPAEITDWFRSGGSEEEAGALENSLRRLLPDLPIVSIRRKPCVVTKTPTGHPYVGFVAPGIGVAIGGNGAGAKSSDEIGRLAATLFSDDGWDPTYDPTALEPQFA